MSCSCDAWLTTRGDVRAARVRPGAVAARWRFALKSRKSGVVIASAVIVLELIGGMQSYLNQLILPILAKDVNGQNFYGGILGFSSIATIAGLPIGAALMNRIRLAKLLLGATLVLILGAVTSALAPTVLVFIAGSVLRGLAGSILAMTSIGAVALGLSGRARQLTLAFASASWVIAWWSDLRMLLGSRICCRGGGPCSSTSPSLWSPGLSSPST